MKALITILDDVGVPIKKDVLLEPFRTEKIYEPATMRYRLIDEFRFSFSRTVPREYFEISDSSTRDGYGYIKDDKPII